MDFGTKLRLMRAMRNMRQYQLTHASGVAGGELSAIENGRMLPTPDIEGAIRNALNWPRELDAILDKLGEVAT